MESSRGNSTKGVKATYDRPIAKYIQLGVQKIVPKMTAAKETTREGKAEVIRC